MHLLFKTFRSSRGILQHLWQTHVFKAPKFRSITLAGTPRILCPGTDEKWSTLHFINAHSLKDRVPLLVHSYIWPLLDLANIKQLWST